MQSTKRLLKQIADLQEMLEVSERKADILTNLLKEAGAEYEQTLKKIQVSEANFRAIFENAPEAIYIVDIETRQILDCNPFIQKWLGYTHDELLTMRLNDILEPGAENVNQNIQKAVQDGKVYVQERRFQKKDGTIVDAEVTGTIMEYEGKRRFVALIRDITERKQIEALSRYKELFESVSDVVFINDEAGHFLEVNDVACQCLGYTREQFLRLTLRDLTCPEYHDTLAQMSATIGENRSYQFELELLGRKGLPIPFEFQGRIISYHNKVGFLSVARDMSIRKKLQETLIKSERLSAVGEMASGVAHNFNNLLQMILAGAEAADAKLKSGKFQDCQEAIQNIINGSRRGADVVRRIKDFTLVTPAGMDKGAVFDLEDLVTEAIELTQPLWKPPSLPSKYRLNFRKSGACPIKGKSSEIYEVLVNLIKNALEAMPHGGSLTLCTETRHDLVSLSIADSGEGIAEEHFQRIFEPFFTTKGTQSSGLGLSSCYGIVKKHQGEIHVDSLPGQGTEFILTFPKAQPVDTFETTAIQVIEKQSPIRFLLIDDEINILKAVEMYFEGSEIDIFTANTAHEGLMAIQTSPFDVILCDLGMDDMNGLEIGKWVGQYCERIGLRKIPFLLYTGLDKQLDEFNLKESGIDRVVNKPTACHDLHSIIREVVTSQK
ncbi:MAG: PAS domain S-box protein [Desulfosarcinaceae bacterium]